MTETWLNGWAPMHGFLLWRNISSGSLLTFSLLFVNHILLGSRLAISQVRPLGLFELLNTVSALWVLLLQSCLALWDSMDGNPCGSSVHEISRKNTGVGCLPSSRGSFNPVTKPATPVSPALQVDSLSTELYTVPSTNRCVCVSACVWKR